MKSEIFRRPNSRPSGMAERVLDAKPVIGDVKEFISCSICKGILQRPLTITLCLHSFCKTCLMSHLQKSKACPNCLALIHPLNPITNVRSDRTLQRFVYKIVPDLFQNELERRKRRLLRKSKSQPVDQDGVSCHINKQQKMGELKQFDEKFAIFTGSENVSLSLQLRPSSLNPDENEKRMDLGVRYLQCPSAVTIKILKRFIENKLALERKLEVNVFYKGHQLSDEYKLSDVAYIYGWTQVEPMLLNYDVLQPISDANGSTAVLTRLHQEPTPGVPLSSPKSIATQSALNPSSSAVPNSHPIGGARSSLSNAVASENPSRTIGLPKSDRTAGKADGARFHAPDRVLRKRGRKRKSAGKASGSPSPAKKRFRVQDSGPGFRKTFVSVADTFTLMCEVFPPTSSSGKGKGPPAANSGFSTKNAAALGKPSVPEASYVPTVESIVPGSNPCLSNNVEGFCSRNVMKTDSGADIGPKIQGCVTAGRKTALVTGKEPTCSPAVPLGLLSANSDPKTSDVCRSVPDKAPDSRPVTEKEHSCSADAVDSSVRENSSSVCNTEIQQVVPDSTLAETAQLTEDSEVVKADARCCVGGRASEVRERSGCDQSAKVPEVFEGNSTEVRLCSKCGQKQNSVDGASVSSTSCSSSSNRRCGDCLCSSASSITDFINHAKKSVSEERAEFTEACRKWPVAAAERTQPQKSTTRLSDSAAEDILPKVECPDYEEGVSTSVLESSYSSGVRAEMTTTAGSRFVQSPTDRHHTKQTGQAGEGERSSGQSNGTFPGSPAPADSSTAQWPALTGSSVDRCPAAATPLTGKRYVRNQKSLESIIRQLHPQQMSPAVTSPGGGSTAAVHSGTAQRPATAQSVQQLPQREPASGRVPASGSEPGSGREPVGGGEPALNRESSHRPTEGLDSMLASRDRIELKMPFRPVSPKKGGSVLRKVLTSSGKSSYDFFRRFPYPLGPEVKPRCTSAGNRDAFNLSAPPIKKLKNMFDGLEPVYRQIHRMPSLKGENRLHQQAAPVAAAGTLAPVRDSKEIDAHLLTSSANNPDAKPETYAYDVTRRCPSLVLTSANGFDAPLELTTKESRDRKRCEIARKSDGDVLRASFPLFDNMR